MGGGIRIKRLGYRVCVCIDTDKKRDATTIAGDISHSIDDLFIWIISRYIELIQLIYNLG